MMTRHWRTIFALALAAPLALAEGQGKKKSGVGGSSTPPAPTINEAAWVTIATSWSTSCGGSSFVTCASVQVRRQNIGGFTAIELTVTNNSGAMGTYPGTVFTAIGIATLPGPRQYPAWLTISRDGDAPNSTGWVGGSDVVQGLTGTLHNDPGGVTTSSGINDGIKPGHTFVFRFYVDAIGTDYSQWQLAIHGQGGPQDCSTKLIVDLDGTTNQPDTPGQCGYTPPPPTPIPEPATMVLLATGLAGIGGAGFFRRRRSQPS